MFAHEIDRSTEIYFQQSAGSYSSRNSFGGVPGFGFPGGLPYSVGAGGLDVENPNSTYLPGQDLVDGRTYYGVSTAGFCPQVEPPDFHWSPQLRLFWRTGPTQVWQMGRALESTVA